MKWPLEYERLYQVVERQYHSVRSFDWKSLRTGSSFDYDDPVRKLFVHEVSRNKLELTTFLYINQNSVTDFIVLVTDFIVELLTLLLLDTTTCRRTIKVLHFRRDPELTCIGENLLTKFYTFLQLGAFPRITAR